MVTGSMPPVAGAMAAVRWVDGRFFLVRVVSPEPRGYRITFQDGTIETVPPNTLVSLVPPPVFRVGDEVMALWQADRMFPGTVTGVSAQGYTVAWHDGDPPLVVPAGRLTYLAWANAAMRVPIEPKPEWQDVTAEVLAPANASTPPLPPLRADRSKSSLTIFLPGNIMPVERGTRFAEPLQDALDRQRLGKIVDEGTQLVKTNGVPTITGCNITVEASDAARALSVIRSTLRAASAPAGTTITDDSGRVEKL